MKKQVDQEALALLPARVERVLRHCLATNTPAVISGLELAYVLGCVVGFSSRPVPTGGQKSESP